MGKSSMLSVSSHTDKKHHKVMHVGKSLENLHYLMCTPEKSLMKVKNAEKTLYVTVP